MSKTIETSAKNDEPAWLKTVVDYGPLAVFFISYKYSDNLLLATKLIIGSTALAVLISFLMTRKVPFMPIVTALLVGIFGGLTLYLQDETFIKMKPTFIQTAFAFILSIGLLLQRIWLKPLMGGSINMPDRAWRILTWRFVCFFLFSASLNEVVWRTQSTDVWVTFKVFGLVGLTIFFIASQLPFINRHADQDSETSDNN